MKKESDNMTIYKGSKMNKKIELLILGLIMFLFGIVLLVISISSFSNYPFHSKIVEIFSWRFFSIIFWLLWGVFFILLSLLNKTSYKRINQIVAFFLFLLIIVMTIKYLIPILYHFQLYDNPSFIKLFFYFVLLFLSIRILIKKPIDNQTGNNKIEIAILIFLLTISILSIYKISETLVSFKYEIKSKDRLRVIPGMNKENVVSILGQPYLKYVYSISNSNKLDNMLFIFKNNILLVVINSNYNLIKKPFNNWKYSQINELLIKTNSTILREEWYYSYSPYSYPMNKIVPFNNENKVELHIFLID